MSIIATIVIIISTLFRHKSGKKKTKLGEGWGRGNLGNAGKKNYYNRDVFREHCSLFPHHSFSLSPLNRVSLWIAITV